jgi:hypothetical protein
VPDRTKNEEARLVDELHDAVGGVEARDLHPCPVAGRDRAGEPGRALVRLPHPGAWRNSEQLRGDLIEASSR